jgi:hypothetical protein
MKAILTNITAMEDLIIQWWRIARSDLKSSTLLGCIVGGQRRDTGTRSRRWPGSISG